MKDTENSSISIFYIYIFVVVLLWISSIFITKHFINDNTNEALFGDSFGALNALFSGLAFAGIIYTIQLQRKELQLQREELKLTRKELMRSAVAQEKSERTIVPFIT